mgnify:CR=1 FL=1
MSLGRKLLFLCEMSIGMSYALSFSRSSLSLIYLTYLTNEVSSLR